ncbi:MAG: type II toxin-antitoxin system VapC family toxin [Calditrichia bacterium]
MRLFVDETAWYALAVSKSPEHSAMKQVFEETLNQNTRMLTHNIAIANAISAVRREVGTIEANRFTEIIEEAHAGAHLSVSWIGRRTQREALRLFKKHADVSLSVFDFASYAIISRRRIHTILTTRRDFEKLGLKVLPEQDDIE